VDQPSLEDMYLRLTGQGGAAQDARGDAAQHAERSNR
jgi:hypothetical protein